MINQFEATAVLLNDLPELSKALSLTHKSASIYQTIRAFVQLTCLRIKEHNYKAAKHCFLLADRLYEQGNGTVRSAIENVFIYSLDSVFTIAKQEKLEVRGLVPGTLYSIYMQQVMQKGC